MSNRSCILGALLVCAQFIAFAADAPVIHIRNFSVVNPHLYRGGQPTPQGFAELAIAHVGTVVDLRETSPQTEAERRLVESLGMKYVGVPFSGFSAPTKTEMDRVLTVITPDDAGCTFVHCLRGKDRTGTVIACYRIQHDGWKPRDAFREARQHGMSEFERGMRSFILAYTPKDLPKLLAGPK